MHIINDAKIEIIETRESASALSIPEVSRYGYVIRKGQNLCQTEKYDFLAVVKIYWI
jgi:hypothetical protein